MDDLLTRDGHLSELTLDRLLQGELDGVAALDAHLAECAECRGAVASARAFDAQVVLRPPMTATESPASGRWPLYGAIVAMAAAVAFLALRADITPDSPMPPTDEFRLKGGFDFQVFAHDGKTSRAVDTGGEVHPGERLGFRFGAKRSGHLMVVGTDGRGEPYLCYPQNTEGAPREMAPEATPRDLEQAVRLDNVLGVEAIVALHCDEPLIFGDAAGVLKGVAVTGDPLPAVRSDCRQRVIHLSKVPRKMP